MSEPCLRHEGALRGERIAATGGAYELVGALLVERSAALPCTCTEPKDDR